MRFLLFAILSLELILGCNSDQAELSNARLERIVVPETLAKILEKTNRIVVSQGREFTAPRILYQSENNQDIESLSAALIVKRPDHFFVCGCMGGPVIYLYQDNKMLAEVTNHHGRFVHCSLWDSHALVVNVEKWVDWFADRRILGPRQQYQDYIEDAKNRESGSLLDTPQDENLLESKLPEGR